MGSSSMDGVDFSSTSKEDCSETSVEIKIKTLDSQTYTLRVDKYVPVPALKEQIANVTGVLSEQQRLICRGKVLKDDQLLSAYHVEDGHTLHLVVREPISSASTPSLVGSSTLPDHLGSRSLGNSFPLTSGLVFGTVNSAGQGDQTTSDLSHIFSSVIDSLGVNNFGTDGAVGYGFERSRRRTRDNIASSDSSQSQTGHASVRDGFDPYRGLQFPSTISSGNQQPTVIPDSCTTLTEYINHMRHEFVANSVRGSNINSDATNSERSEGQRHDSHQHPSARQSLPTPASLAEVMLSARQLLIEQAAECLSELATQLQNQGNVTNSQTRASIQSDAMRSGVHLQNLGPLLLELGRTIMTLRMGQSPEEAVVNAGPAIFLSASGPNPIMVQAGTSFSGFSMGTIHPGQGPTMSLGPGILSRNIDITIRRGQVTGDADGTPQVDGFQQLENIDGARNSVANSVHEALQAGRASAGREPTVRFVPIRTVIAIPSSSHRPSNSSGESDASLHSLFGRLQQQVLGNINDTRSSLASNEHNIEVPEGSIMDADRNISDTHGSEQIHYDYVANVLTGSAAEVHVTQSSPQTPAEAEVHVTQSSPQTLATGSAGDQIVRSTEEDDFSRHDNADGIFFSALVRQLMPLLSQNGTSEDSVVSSLNPEFSSEQAEDQNPTDERNCINSPDAPLAKRQKKK